MCSTYTDTHPHPHPSFLSFILWQSKLPLPSLYLFSFLSSARMIDSMPYHHPYTHTHSLAYSSEEQRLHTSVSQVIIPGYTPHHHTLEEEYCTDNDDDSQPPSGRSPLCPHYPTPKHKPPFSTPSFLSLQSLSHLLTTSLYTSSSSSSYFSFSSLGHRTQIHNHFFFHLD